MTELGPTPNALNQEDRAAGFPLGVEFPLGHDPIMMAIYINYLHNKTLREQGKRCYWVGNSQVHVKPSCRCGRRGPSWW
jgi:hypothetical protein